MEYKCGLFIDNENLKHDLSMIPIAWYLISNWLCIKKIKVVTNCCLRVFTMQSELLSVLFLLSMSMFMKAQRHSWSYTLRLSIHVLGF